MDSSTEAQQPPNKRTARVSFGESTTVSSLTSSSSPHGADARLPPAPSDQARSVVFSALVSLPESIKSFTLLHFDRFLALHKELDRLTSKQARFADDDYIPVSARVKLNLNFSDSARKLCKRLCEKANNDCISAVRDAQKSMKKAIEAALEAEIYAKKRLIARTVLLGFNEISRAVLISMGYSEKQANFNDIHHHVCVRLVNDKLCRANSFIDRPSQHVFDLLHEITGHIKHTHIGRSLKDNENEALDEPINVPPIATQANSVSASSPSQSQSQSLELRS